jgi:hypothetical protein
LAVCDQLREIALQKNDDELSHQADELQAQAWAVYSKHIVSISPGRTEGSRIASQTSVHAGESAKAGTKEEMP